MISCLLLVAGSTHVLSIAGNGGGILVPASPVLLPKTELTIEAWVKPHPDDSAGPYHFIVSKNYGGTGYAMVLIGRGDSYRFQFEANGTVDYHEAMPTLSGHWWHVAGVFSSSDKLRLYINGVLVNEAAAKGEIKPNDLPLRIGLSLWDSFPGEIDDVKLWSVARTSEQVLWDRDHHAVGNEPGLIGYWDFEHNGRGGITYDRSHHTKPGQVKGPARIVRTKLGPPGQ